VLRFEASPSSELTLGHLRVALINALTAQQRREGFLLRITDHDPAASTFDPQPFLDKCLHYDQRQHQSENLRRYRHLASTLLQAGNAYVCTCDPDTPCQGACPDRTPQEIETLHRQKHPYSIRIVAPTAPIMFADAVQGAVTVLPEEIGSFWILDPDGTPSECFAAAVDDMLSGITLILRENSQRPQAAREIHIRTLLGFTETIDYGHIAPLSGAVPTVRALFEEGILPDAMITYLLSIGQTPPQPHFTLSDAAAWFDLAALAKTPAPCDPLALRAHNRRHLERMDDKALSGLYQFADADIGRLVKLYLDDAATLSELDRYIRPIFAPKPCDGENAQTLKTLSSLILSAPPFKTFEPFYAHIQNQSGFDDATLQPLLRQLLTGTTQGPALHEVYPHLKSYITEVARCQP